MPRAASARGLMRVPRLLLLLLLLFAVSTPALARSWRISNFNSNIKISPDGETTVSENITLVFVGTWNGIYRNIPVEYRGPNGTNYTLFLHVDSVTDEYGGSLKYEKNYQQGELRLKIYIPGAVDTTKTVRITYSSPDAVRWFPDHDEFYWNVTGNDWPVPIDYAAAMVSLPANTAGQLRAQAFTGSYGSTEKEATSTLKGPNVLFETTNPLQMRGGLTVDIYVPKGLLHEPGMFTKVSWFLRSNPIVFLPVLAFLVMFLLWRWKGRDPDIGLSVAPMYEPPKGFTPAEVGTLVDDSLDSRDITCTLIDLAVKGFIKIEDTSEKVLIFTSHNYAFHLLKTEKQWADLAEHERTMLERIFPGKTVGEVRTLAALTNQFYTAIPRIKEEIFAALKEKHVYAVDPQQANWWRVLAVALIIIPFLGLHALGAFDLFTSAWLAVVSVVATILIVWLFGRQMSAKTLSGQKTYIQVLGFQEFMTRVDADRLRTMPPDTFEKCLPYAMALGVEHQWSKKFEGILKTPPQWYQGGPGYMNFNPYVFTNTLGGMTQQAANTFVSAPRASSSGSGFSGGGFSGGGGGGFSGGGFGGGGGGAF